MLRPDKLIGEVTDCTVPRHPVVQSLLEQTLASWVEKLVSVETTKDKLTVVEVEVAPAKPGDVGALGLVVSTVTLFPDAT